jgi:hypothetical protein
LYTGLTVLKIVVTESEWPSLFYQKPFKYEYKPFLFHFLTCSSLSVSVSSLSRISFLCSTWNFFYSLQSKNLVQYWSNMVSFTFGGSPNTQSWEPLNLTMKLYQLDGSFFMTVLDKDECVAHGFCNIISKQRIKI